jgi:hypothetical protein
VNDYFPNAVLKSEPGFLTRTQVRLDKENTLIVTLGDIGPESGNTFGSFIFDIDRIVEKELSAQQSVLKQEIDHLHLDVWSVFSATKGERLEALLEKRQALIQLLKEWCEDDAHEQYETLEYLKQALDEGRLSDRKLFQ